MPKNLLLLIIVLVLAGCDKNTSPTMSRTLPTSKEDAFKENYRFYPIGNQFIWIYDHYEIDPFPLDTLIRKDLIKTYNQESQQMTTMFGPDTFSYNWFGNFNNKLASGSFIALDYSLLAKCDSDSVLIFSDTINGTIRNRYQYCDFKFSQNPYSNYDGVPCLKSVLYIQREDGSLFIGEYYYAKDLGELERTNVLIDNLGKIRYQQSYFLKEFKD